MFAIFTIVFRELLEIILIINLVLAATKTIPNNLRYIFKGLVIGSIGAGIISYYSSALDDMGEGIGQELLNGITLLLTAIMIGTSLIWINKNAKKDNNNIQKLSADIHAGTKTNYSITWLISLLIFREGSELGIYLISIINTNDFTLYQIIGSITLGILLAIIVNIFLYKGTISYFKKYIFKITNILLILVAAGMASQASNYFIAAGIFPELIDNFWDSSKILSINSEMGRFLKILIGYDDRPNLTSLIFYLITIIIICYGLKLSNKSHKVLDNVK